jgi:uncharacterized protein YggE
MKTTPFAGAALALLLAGAAVPAALAQPAPDAAAEAWRATSLTLSASGEVKAQPDMATISLGVHTEAPTAAQAMADNASRMSEVVAALKRQGIEARDIQTSGLNLNPQYAYEPNQPPRLTGYQASNQVAVTVNDLSRLGRTLDGVVAVGANQISGISFGLKDSKAAEDAARLKAVQALQAKAQLYAGATGYRVARLVSLSEGQASIPPPRPIPFAAAKMAEAASTPVEAGQLTVRADVSATFELAK